MGAIVRPTLTPGDGTASGVEIRDNRPMIDRPVAASRRRGPLLLADISGYTSFLRGVADAHREIILEADEPPQAYALLSHLLDTMVAAVAPTFRLAKFEGDAVFAVADDGVVQGESVLACLRACYSAFRDRLAAAGSQWTCTCAACARISELDLKFVLHHGEYVAQSIAGREELLGPDVNVVHRLLKNHARELVGPVPYALVTEAAAAAMSIPTAAMVSGQETYPDTPPIRMHVLALVQQGETETGRIMAVDTGTAARSAGGGEEAFLP